MVKLILASKSKVRKQILDNHNIVIEVQPSSIDEEPIKQSLLKERSSPEIISGELFSLSKLCFIGSSSIEEG